MPFDQGAADEIDGEDISPSSVDTGSVNTEEASITAETLLDARAGNSTATVNAGTWLNPNFNEVNKDELGEFSSDQFTPDSTGFYLVIGNIQAGSTDGSQGDRLRTRLQNVTDGVTVVRSGDDVLGASENFYEFPEVFAMVELTAGKSYQIEAKNIDSSFGFSGTGEVNRFQVRFAFR